MTSERWQTVAAIYERLSETAPAEREAALASACGGDAEIRSEVEALLAQDDRSGPFESPLWSAAPAAPRIAPGTMLGAYRVDELVGTGGMGEVYRGWDAGLNRTIAIKVLPLAQASAPDGNARFRREARLLAALHHPNIAGIYGFEETSNVHALILEFVDGPTLADRLKRGPLPVDDALAVARQLAEALEAAHEQGIVHRDLKPANVKVTGDGAVKVLDFGLAKLSNPPSSGGASDTGDSPAITSPTVTGMVLGTAAYMSPEQAKGRVADKRSDVWAFGCVLYEMLTGTRAFACDTITETLAAVLRTEPDWTALPLDTPPLVVWLLRQCLMKERKMRVGDLAAARLLLTTPPEGASVPPRRRPVGWLTASVALGAAAVAAALILRPVDRVPREVVRFSIPVTRPSLGGGTGLPVIAVSPDGQRIAYVTQDRRLLTRRLSETATQAVAGSEGAIGDAVFAPDGQSIAFFVSTEAAPSTNFFSMSKGVIKVAGFDGRAPRAICEVGSAIGISWYGNDLYVGQFSTGVLRVSSAGGQPEVVVPIDTDEVAAAPQMLPGGRALLFTRARGLPRGATTLDQLQEVSRALWSNARVVVQPLDRSASITLVEHASDGRFVSSGHLLYGMDGTLFAAPFDARTFRLSAPGRPVISGVSRTRRGSSVPTGLLHYGVADNGTLVYLAGPASESDESMRDLGLLTADRAPVRLQLPPRLYAAPVLSPDRGRIAVSADDGESAGVWIVNRDGHTPPRQLTFEGRNRYPVWLDDRRVVFQSDRGGDLALYSQLADGSAAAERVTTAAPSETHTAHDWSPANRRLLFSIEKRVNGKSEFSLWTKDGDEVPQPVPGSTSASVIPAGTFSHDGKWIAYQAGEVPSPHIVVRPFPVRAGVVYQLPEVGRHPRWSADDRRILFTSGPRLMGVGVLRSPAFQFLKTSVVLEGLASVSFAPMHPNYDLLDDTTIVGPVVPAGVPFPSSIGAGQIEVVLNWFDELPMRVAR